MNTVMLYALCASSKEYVTLPFPPSAMDALAPNAKASMNPVIAPTARFASSFLPLRSSKCTKINVMAPTKKRIV